MSTAAMMMMMPPHPPPCCAPESAADYLLAVLPLRDGVLPRASCGYGDRAAVAAVAATWLEREIPAYSVSAPLFSVLALATLLTDIGKCGGPATFSRLATLVLTATTRPTMLPFLSMEAVFDYVEAIATAFTKASHDRSGLNDTNVARLLCHLASAVRPSPCHYSILDIYASNYCLEGRFYSYAESLVENFCFLSFGCKIDTPANLLRYRYCMGVLLVSLKRFDDALLEYEACFKLTLRTASVFQIAAFRYFVLLCILLYKPNYVDRVLESSVNSIRACNLVRCLKLRCAFYVNLLEALRNPYVVNHGNFADKLLQEIQTSGTCINNELVKDGLLSLAVIAIQAYKQNISTHSLAHVYARVEDTFAEENGCKSCFPKDAGKDNQDDCILTKIPNACRCGHDLWAAEAAAANSKFLSQNSRCEWRRSLSANVHAVVNENAQFLDAFTQSSPLASCIEKMEPLDLNILNQALSKESKIASYFNHFVFKVKKN